MLFRFSQKRKEIFSIWPKQRNNGQSFFLSCVHVSRSPCRIAGLSVGTYVGLSVGTSLGPSVGTYVGLCVYTYFFL